MATIRKKVTAKKSSIKNSGKSISKTTGKKVSSKTKTSAKKPAKKVTTNKIAASKKTSPVKVSATKSTAKKNIAKKTAKPNAAKNKTPKNLKTKKVAPKKETKAKTTVSKAKVKKGGAVKRTAASEKKAASQKTKVTKASIKEETDHQKLLKKAVKAKKASDKKKNSKEKPFVMPVTHTDKVRKYKPDFTKSILDQPDPKPSGPTLRYSDSELAEFRDIITKKLISAKKELAYLQGLITRKDHLGGDSSENRYMTMEDGSLSMEREQLAQMASRQISFIDHLEKALIRIENKTYGICRVTGRLIDKARLRAVPHATLSIEAKMGITK